MVNEPMNPFEEEIKANEQDAALITEEFQPAPYAYTSAVQQEEMKGWRQMLIDNHAKRQKENKKRVRNAQILGIGKALGDMIGAIWGGAASSRNNAPAVVPAPQASKTAEQVEKLIREGVVNAQDYDKMMLNLSMQEGKDKIALAKAMDELGIRQGQLAEQREYEQKKLEDAHERDLEKIKARGEWQQTLATLKSDLQSAREAKRAENAVALAKIKGKIQERIKQLGGVGNLDWFTYESLQELFPGEVEFTTTTTAPNKYGELQTKTVKGTRKQPQGTAQAKMTAQENEDFAKRVGLKIEEKQFITELRTLVANGRYTEEQIKLMIAQARNEGKSVADLIKLLNPNK
ncbi:MAG: hypothetical protein IKJ08_07195 [Alistipes sp.]|nr:hypothetical protein [Alistipes sp.]